VEKVVRRRNEFPSQGELVMGTISEVFPEGAFVRLEEYGGKVGLVHLSEVASGWIKNIREHIREGQTVVCRVMGVDEKRGHVDLSMRRVKESEKAWKREQFRREERAEKLLKLAAKKLRKSLDEAYQEAGFKLQEKFGDMYTGLERVAKEGTKALEGLDLGKRWVNALARVSSSLVETPFFKVVGYLGLSSTAPDGVERIRRALLKAREEVSRDGVRVEIYYVGSPKYRVEVSASSYKEAEAVLRRVAEVAINSLKAEGGKGEFHAGRGH
jgi:translation initiation factor 2 subunit 1